MPFLQPIKHEYADLVHINVQQLPPWVEVAGSILFLDLILPANFVVSGDLYGFRRKANLA